MLREIFLLFNCYLDKTALYDIHNISANIYNSYRRFICQEKNFNLNQESNPGYLALYASSC